MVRGCACGLIALLLLAATGARAGGLLALEVGITRNGTAGAGSAAYASDASTGFYNPAGMARLERAEAVIGANLILSQVELVAFRGQVARRRAFARVSEGSSPKRRA